MHETCIYRSGMSVAGHIKKNKRNALSIRAAARALDVDWSHLSRVIKGERVSRRLLMRYRALKGASK